MDFNYIRIEKLFGQFDYRIDFSDLSNNVKIITAPNGYGKSTILKIIDNFINQKFDQLLNYEFASFEISFNRSIFYIKRESNTLYIRDNNSNSLNYSKEDLLEFSKNFQYIIRRELPFLKKLSINKWIDERDDEILSSTEVKNRYHYIFENSDLLDNKTEWLHRVIENEKVVFIQTNRLINVAQGQEFHQERSSAVLDLSEKILELRNDIVRTQFHISMDQGSKFPERVMDLLSKERSININDVSEKMIKISRFDKIYNKNDLFGNLGLKSSIISRLKKEEIYDNDSFLLVLNSYLEDIVERINFCDDLARRIHLFKEAVNSLFQFKSIDFHPTDGIIVQKKNKGVRGDVAYTKESFKIDDLSSGEQHLIILLGNLIFNTVANTLVLIDEPEISLHAAWQKKLLNLIDEIAKTNNFQVIVATHSFILINGNWKNTIELAELKS